MSSIEKFTTIDGVPYVRESWANAKISFLEERCRVLKVALNDAKSCLGRNIATCLSTDLEPRDPFADVSETEMNGFTLIAGEIAGGTRTEAGEVRLAQATGA